MHACEDREVPEKLFFSLARGAAARRYELAPEVSRRPRRSRRSCHESLDVVLAGFFGQGRYLLSEIFEIGHSGFQLAVQQLADAPQHDGFARPAFERQSEKIRVTIKRAVEEDRRFDLHRLCPIKHEAVGGFTAPFN